MKPFVHVSRLAVRLSLLMFFGATAVCAQTLELEKFERLPDPVIDPASDDAKLALQRFSLPQGLKASLWAAEPMLANPVAIDFDEKGRLFVSETYRYRSSVLDIRGYMGMLELDMALRTIEDRLKLHRTVFGEAGAKQLAIEGEVVRLVEDKDGDGVADASRVFSDGYNHELDGIASGVLARYGQVWFTNIPSLYRLDEQPDGSVKKNELLRGFGVRYNFTGHDFHGLAMGHDGKLYYSIGDRGTHVVGKEGQVVDYPDEGAVFRSNPDGTEFELFAHGLRNPQELVFDEHGNLFTGDNDSDQRDMERLVYLVEGGDSGWRVGYQHPPMGNGGPWIRESLWKPAFKGRPAYLLPPVCNIEDGPSGLTYYPGTGLTPAYAGHFFITHFKGSIARSGIQTYTLKEDGASFKPTSSQQFMGGVLPTDVTFGPDGVLYLSDWVDGWPKSQKGRIYGITPVNADPAAKAQSAELAKLLAAGMKGRGDAELSALLAHADRRARLEAQLELAARGDQSIAVFSKVANNGKAAPLARLHAVWGLTQLGRKNAKVGPLLVKLAKDNDAEVRAQAVKGLGDIKFTKARKAVEARIVDVSPRVRFFAAQSLGKIGDSDSANTLLSLLQLNDNQDEYIRHAATYALSRIKGNVFLMIDTEEESAAVRLGKVLAYRHLRDAKVARYLNDSDAYVAREAAIAINDSPIEGAYPALAAKLDSVLPSDDAFVSRAINAHYRLGDAKNADALAQYATRESSKPEMRAEALLQLGLWGKTPQRDRVVGIYRPLPARDGKPAADALTAALPKLLDNDPEVVQLAVLEAIGGLQLKSAAPALLATVANDKAPEAVRIGALKTMDAFGSDAITLAIDAADKSSSAALRLAALQVAASRAPARALPIVTRFAKDGTEAEQQAAFLSLAQLKGPEKNKLLISSLDQLAAGKVRPGAQLELIEAAEKSDAPEVKARWARQQAAWKASGKPLAEYSYTLAGGDARRGGQEFFENEVLPCARCHKVSGNGGEAGPDLTFVGKEKSPEYLLESVLKPSLHIAAGFDLVTVTLKNGNTETGSVADETGRQLVLKRADGSSVTLQKADIAQRVTAPSSMPDIYGQVLTRSQLRDMVAFLTGLKQEWRDSGETGMNDGGRARAMQSVAVEGKTGGHE
jgi:quinoprotein glucose dehydrogenase